ncbi:uncharacterized protein LOC27208802 [Drosophila simulans]|uniref:uncharacterized protein LOC27208802 n=1 Tax=Drosophila simulans TaxID=7240 RepID=UPI00192CF27D|nr:uncharacterized protein LOC27208802 [Drosophila simulans]XP_039150247.1 uncharacterized protein LOC27208802 [Drosophila simulans]XP_044778884.1 uncharacterized protein LOC27208802 [Drosophila simulans]
MGTASWTERGEFRSWETGGRGRTLLHRVFVPAHMHIDTYIWMYLWRDEGIGKQLDAVGESWRWYFAHHGVQSTTVLRSCRVALTVIVFPRAPKYSTSIPKPS